MNKILLILCLGFPLFTYGQTKKDTNTKPKVFKKKVLESAEINLLMSLYTQKGENAAVTGGIGNESLSDFATNVDISIPINADDVFNVDATVSAYTSASSSNLDPFGKKSGSNKKGSPWVAASGASKMDTWANINLAYSHTSDDRNTLTNGHIGFATEFDYTSFGFGGGIARQFNQKNTELGLKGNIYIDFWNPQSPIEIRKYIKGSQGLSSSFFSGTNIYDQQGNITSKNGNNTWSPFENHLLDTDNRNSFSASLSFSQILTKWAQVSFFSDVVLQKGWLANPMQRVYFLDRPNYYIGDPNAIKNYTSTNNKSVFQLADDIERLPQQRLKYPIGSRLNIYFNEYIVLNTYYRYYFDSWNLKAHTFNVKLPLKITEKYTLYPSFRYYTQTQADFFSPYETHLSSESFYTSDNDLSSFDAMQFGFGIKYTDIFTKHKLWKFGVKNWSIDYAYYKRNTGLQAHIITFGAKIIVDKIDFKNIYKSFIPN